LCAFVDPQCCALLRVGVGTVHNGILQDSVRIPFDVVLECAGVAVATSDALRVVRRRGVVVQVGMLPNVEVGVNVAPLVAKEVQLRGTFRFRDEVDRAVEMLRDPIFDTVITHEFAVDDVVEAFDTAADSQVSGKVVVAL
ncbi:zinc-binding dehydrogenase, partial [Corynebacterium diphtheriae]